MRALFLVLFSFILSFNIIAQPNVNKLDDQGRKTGKWLSYYPGGKKKYEGTFKDGYEIGTFKFYNGNGQLISELLYSQKGEYASARMFYTNGIVKAEGRFHNRKKDGVWKYYSKLPHVLYKEESYKDGKKDGPWRVYYPSGKLSSEIYWKNDLRHGSWNDFFENGDPHIEATFENGLLEGTYTAYFVGTIVAKEGEYVNGKMDGIWRIYNEKAELVKKERYSNGFLQEEAFFANGKLIDYKSSTTTKFNDDFKDAE
jgi:antitoxin component YwqK of YwqJK toxin-antitoxin module